MSPHDPEMTAVVHREVGEALDRLLELIDASRRGEGTPGELVRAAFRIFHNTKGALRLGGFAAAEQIAHAVEDRLADLRATGEAPSSDLVELMVQALSVCLQAIEEGGEHPALAAIAGRLERLSLVGHDQPATDPREAPRGDADARSAEPARADDATGLRGVGADLIRVDPERLDRLMALGSEYLAQHARTRRHRQALRDFADRLGALTRRLPAQRELLDPLALAFERLVREEEHAGRRAGQLNADFDRAMREVRMQPLAVLVPQLRRIVAEVSRELGKRAHLVVDHREVELDRKVIDALREPLMHLLRNAIDHGLEPEQERVAKGKPGVGAIHVAARVNGSHVELRVSDDGRGIDVDRVRARAVELGLLGAEAAGAAASIDAALFAPGFSTASRVTSVSGRGVGLDVVRSRVGELGGQVFTEARGEDAGVSFVLSVPASIVSLRGVVVGAGGATLVVPSIHVERTLRVEASALGSAEGVTVMPTPEGEPLRLRWLAAALGLARSSDPPVVQIVVVAEGSQRLGLVVDAIHGDTTFVINKLPWNVRRAPGVIGVTHLGDAELALVIEVANVFRPLAGRADDDRLQVAAPRRKPHILVADDSLTSRTLERNILVGAGYDVTVVEDGEAALRALVEGDFQLLVSDVQMPGLDGLQLTRAVRADARLARLPILLVTSLERPEDVAEGALAGADEYIVKGRFDQEALLEAVSRFL